MAILRRFWSQGRQQALAGAVGGEAGSMLGLSPEVYYLRLGEVSCKAGAPEEPVHCTWHREHFYCATCEGFYGAPHDSIHQGATAHPATSLTVRQQCACRLCKRATNRG